MRLEAVFQWLRKLSGRVAQGRWFRGRPDVDPLDLERDWSALQPLLAGDDLPDKREDVIGWLAQDGAVALVARREGRFAGCMVGHPAGSVAHIDTVSLPREFQRASITRPLYFRGVNALKVQGAKGFVAHARPRPGRLLELLGYSPTATFRLVARTAQSAIEAGATDGELLDHHAIALDEAVDLDAAVFGARRQGWLQHLLSRSDAQVLGLRRRGELTALLVVLVDGDSRSIRLAEGHSFDDIASVLRADIGRHQGARTRCWVRDGGTLHPWLAEQGFEPVPDTVPFTEYRLGATEGIGDGDGVLQLSWW